MNSLIIVHRVPADTIQEGDIISFYSRDPVLHGAVNTHRVSSIVQEEGQTVMITRGDANPMEDSYPVLREDVIGVVVFSSLFLGKTALFTEHPLVFFPFLVLPIVVMLISNLLSTIQAAKELAHAELTDTAGKDGSSEE